MVVRNLVRFPRNLKKTIGSFREKKHSSGSVAMEVHRGLDTAWRNDTADAATKFLQKLRESRAREFMQNKEFLQMLRFEPETTKRMQRWFGAIWARQNTDIYKLIAQACNENWDLEDEEKHAFVRETAKKQSALNKQIKQHDDLAATREKGARRREYQLQGIVEESERLLEEEQGRVRLRCVGSTKEAQARKEKTGCRRGAEFYRRAGGANCT